MLTGFALEVGRFVLVDNAVLQAFVHGRGELGIAFLSGFLVAGFSCSKGLLAKGLHAAGEGLIAVCASFVLTHTFESGWIVGHSLER